MYPPQKRLPSSKVNIQYMSDLHLERCQYEFDVSKAAPILALAGDIGRFCDTEKYANFLRKQCHQFDQVLLLAGNHEFYGSSRVEGLKAAERLMSDGSMAGKLVFLNRTRHDIAGSDVVVLGCTLQSHIGSDCGKLTNDFRRIQDWTTVKHNTEHQLDLDWLRRSIESIAMEQPKKRILVMTHYAPAFEKTCHPANEYNAASQCFSSHTLKALQTWAGHEKVVRWVFGHTHWNAQFKSGITTVCSNQLCNDSFNLTWLQRRLKYRPFDKHAVIKL